jgi:hypothetical protein
MREEDPRSSHAKVGAGGQQLLPWWLIYAVSVVFVLLTALIADTNTRFQLEDLSLARSIGVGWAIAVDLAQMSGAFLAFLALVFAWSDRMARERPQVVFREFRRDSTGTEAAITNIGLGPAYRLRVEPLERRISMTFRGRRLVREGPGMFYVGEIDVLQVNESLHSETLGNWVSLEFTEFVGLAEVMETVEVDFSFLFRASYLDRSRTVGYLEDFSLVGSAKTKRVQLGQNRYKVSVDELSVFGATPLESTRKILWKKVLSGRSRKRFSRRSRW